MPSGTVLVGLCTGLLAATAVSISQNVLDLVTNALKIVRVAFRLGIKVNDAAQRSFSFQHGEINHSWARLVVGVQKEDSIAEVTQFNERRVRKFTSGISILLVKLINMSGFTTGQPSLYKLQQ